MNDEFLANASPELRTPLTPVLGGTRTLQRGNPLPAIALTAYARAEAKPVDPADLLSTISQISAAD